MRIGAFLAWTRSAIVLISCRFFFAVRFAALVRILKNPLPSFAHILHSAWSLPILVAVATVAGILKSFSLLDLRFVEKGAEVYSKG